jgi:hypothetical protein
MADNLPPSRPMSRNLEALTYPEPSGPHRPVMGFLYLFLVRLEVISNNIENVGRITE